MDLAAPHDDVLAQKDQANTAFVLHGSGSRSCGLHGRANIGQDMCRPIAAPDKTFKHAPKAKSQGGEQTALEM